MESFLNNWQFNEGSENAKVDHPHFGLILVLIENEANSHDLSSTCE